MTEVDIRHAIDPETAKTLDTGGCAGTSMSATCSPRARSGWSIPITTG